MEERLVKLAERSAAARYGVAVAAALGGLLLRLSVASILGSKVPYITFFLATAVSATFGGFGPGLVTTFLGAILAAVYVISPDGTLIFSDASDFLALMLFIVTSSFISYLAGRLIEATQHQNALRVLFEQTLVSIGDAVISTDEQKRVRLLNPAAEQLTGWKQAEAKGKPIEEVFRIVEEGTDTPAEVPIVKVLRTGKVAGLSNHTELITKDGRRIPIDDSAAPIRNEKGLSAGAVLVFRDITERRSAEVALRKAERRSREILQSITDAFMVLDQDWRITYLNPAGEKIFERPAQALLGRSYWDEFPDAVGTEIERSYRRAMAERTAVHFETHYAAWDRWFEIDAYPSRTELAVYLRDITARKRTEAALLLLNEDLKQFTFAATHDLREPLRTMTVCIQMLQRRLGEQLDPDSRGYMSQVINGGARMFRLIDGLLEFTRLGDVGRASAEAASAEDALREALDNLQLVLAESRANVAYDELPVVMADPTHLSQLFQNLVGNALKYSKPGLPPEVRISAERENSSWVFAVQDNGIGVPPEYQAQIFLPFKRLHGPELAGAGIGLATCKRIVERYGGQIWVESEEGQGSTFRFTLPGR